MTDEINKMRQCIKCKSSYTLENFKEKKREQSNKTCINCCTMQKEKIEAEQKHISERKKQYFRENKRSIPQQVCLRCGRNKLEDSYKRNTDGQLFKTCIACMESEKQYRGRNKDKLHNYYNTVKEKKIAQTKEWREENNERLNEQLTCGCGGKFKYRNKAEHNRGKTHIAWAALGNEEAN